MNWFLVALIGPALWSASNHIDKHLLESHFKNLSTGSLYLFGGTASLLVVIAVLLIHPASLGIPAAQATVLTGASILGSGMLYCYLQALRDNEATVVTSYFQLNPIFYGVLAYVIFGERLTAHQLAGSGLVMIGALTLSFDMASEMRIFHFRTAGWMFLACLLSSFNGLAFKWVGLNSGYWSALFWDNCGMALISGVIAMLAPKPWKEFRDILSQKPTPVLGLLVVNECLTVSGNVAMRFAQLLAPLALVQIANGFQPIFVLVYGVVLTSLFPNFGYERILRQHVVQKVLSVLLILAGTYALNK